MATTRGVSILSTVDYTLEVIGNIYENPELMEGNND
ncbi:YopX family protein [Streptococcus suis]|nr:YopX family protein [Streptococcus suis]MCL4913586.1 YopX family protein [Streptococcus suis]MDC1544376.1 YopX family protein [Streptococcus suis]